MADNDFAWLAAVLALALLVGPFIALASVKLPKNEPVAWDRAALPRILAVTAATLAIALWAMAVVPGPLGVFTVLLGWWLLPIAILDGEHFWLPDRLTIPLGLFGLIAAAFIDSEYWIDHAIGAAAGFLVLTLIALLYRRLRKREGLGGGDPRLLAAGGAWVGWIGLPSVLVWASAAALAAVAIAAMRGRGVSLAQRIPLGVYLALGIWLTWLYGPLGL